MKILVFSLIILDGISESWQPFGASKFKISFKILSLSTFHLYQHINAPKKLRVLFADLSYGEHARVISIFLLTL